MICDCQKGKPLPVGLNENCKQLNGFEVGLCDAKMDDFKELQKCKVAGEEEIRGPRWKEDGLILSIREGDKGDQGDNTSNQENSEKKTLDNCRDLILSIEVSSKFRSANGDEKHHQLEKQQRDSSQLVFTTTTTTTTTNRQQENQKDQTNQMRQRANLDSIKVTPKRYFILFMFVVLQVSKSFQWICLAGITNVVANFYQVDNLAINWTTILFMVTFLILALPVSWLMDSIGLRYSVLVGSAGVTIGIIIKCFSCTRQGFNLSMLGHLIIGLSEPFFFSSYSQLASIWFPDHQVAMATAASLIGEQTGLALGFIIPPLMIGNDPNDFDTIQRGLARLFLVFAVICTINTCSILFFFDAKPKFAPGIARFRQISAAKLKRRSLACYPVSISSGSPNSAAAAAAATGHNRPLSMSSSEPTLIGRGRRLSRCMGQSLGEQMKVSGKLITNKNFFLLLLGFGMNAGISYSLHTLLNQLIIRPSGTRDNGQLVTAAFASTNTSAADVLAVESAAVDPASGQPAKWRAQDSNLVVGNAGLILIVSGLIGSALCGFVLDRYHKHKLTTALVYVATLVSMAALSGCLLLESELLLYLVTIPLGFSLTGYASCAFDYAVEITYPKSELLTSTLLNISAQLFGIPISLVGSLIVDNYGSQALGAFFCAILLTGSLVSLLQGGRLRRQEAIQENPAPLK